MDNGDGTWTWSYFTVDGPDETQTVTITATEAAGGPSASTTFPLQVLNAAPAILLGDVAGAPNDRVQAGPNQPAVNNGTFSDPGNDGVVLTANLGAVHDAGNGAWTWSLNAWTTR